jgi:hypothetical protein
VIKNEFLTRVKCKGADGTKKAVFKKLPFVPEVFKFNVTAKKLSVQPFLFDRVTITLTTGSIDRPDQIGNLVPCQLKKGRDDRYKINCREPIGF